ncbi:MAG: hypothetical protein COC16_03440 [Lutibacter sp.]|nr:MAG: hypothetical protein COC16_03440 [Lutibacter sp.]
MTGNVVLDVVIGLVFIYLLYSLFATIIMEIITSIFGLRARNLRYTLRRMLMDERAFEGNKLVVVIRKFSSKMINTLVKIRGTAWNLENPETFDSFYEQPTIKYLSGGGISNKPSYITDKNFSKALIDVLKSGSAKSNSLDKIKDSIDNLGGRDTKKHLKSLLEDADNDLSKFKLLLEQWYNDTMERSIGWFKKRVQYILFIIGLVLAVSFNANTLDIIEKLSNDPEARQQLVDLAINYSKDNKETIAYVNALEKSLKNKDTFERDNAKDSILLKKIDTLLSISQTIKTDIDEVKHTIKGNWRIPDRLKVLIPDSIKTHLIIKEILKDTSLVYKKVLKDSLVFTHCAIIVEENKDTIILFAIDQSIDFKKLKNNIPKKISRKQLIHGIPIKPFKYKSGILNTLKALPFSLKTLKDSLVFSHPVTVNKKKKDTILLFSVHQSIDVDLFNKIIPEKISRKELANGIPIKPYKYKWRYVFATDSFLNFKHLWGYILTALAISLGAPFWFDLLNKLIKLRSSVSQCESKKQATTK